MSSVSRPVHGINLSQVALECPLGLHQLVPGNRLMGLLCNSANCTIGTIESALQCPASYEAILETIFRLASRC